VGWVSPTGHEDPWEDWSNDTNAYDDDTGSYATNSTPATHELILTHAALDCDKVRLWAMTAPADPGITVRVYYTGAWHSIHDGAFTESEYCEFAIGSTESVTKVEFKTKGATSFYIYEVDFNEVVGGEEKLLTATSSTTSSTTSSLTLGKIEAMVATANVSSSISALLIIEYSIQAHAPPVTSVAGTLTVGRVESLSATSSGILSVAGSLSLGVIESLASSANLISSITSPILRIIFVVSGIASPNSSIQGILSVFRLLTGTASAVNGLSSSLTLGRIEILDATSNTLSIIAVNLSVILILSSTISTIASISGSLRVIDLVKRIKKLIQLIEIGKW